MEFFDRKEEVMDIQLTQFGKHLLSKGDFKPVYYAYYDDDILYDSQYGGFSEDQNATKDRITKETPRLKAQYVYYSIEKDIKEKIEKVQNKKAFKDVNAIDGVDKGKYIQVFQPTNDKHYALPLSMGNSSYESEKAPAWQISFLYGTMTGSVDYSTASMQPALKIPQLNTTIKYEVFEKNVNDKDD